MGKKYQGIVSDRLNVLCDKKTRWKNTLKDASDCAENLCKKYMADRGKIKIVDNTGYIY